MIATSLDGQWAAVRRGREVTLFASGAGEPVGRIELEGDDADIAFVGPPAMLAVVSRSPEAKVTLHQPPYLDAVTRLDLDAPLSLAAVTGQRMILVSANGKQLLVVRGAGRALSSQAVDTGTPVEFAVGLERNQMLLGLLRKLEVWDAVSGRPLLRLQLQLPPPPRGVGSAQGHLWATRPGTDEVYVYRLSDGRPFRHHAGARVDDVVCHPASPLIVLCTPRGLVRLHCFAHSLAVIDAPWELGQPLGQLAAGDDISLVGIAPETTTLWRVPISGAGAPIIVAEGAETTEPISAPAGAGPAVASAADRLRSMRDRGREPTKPPPLASTTQVAGGGAGPAPRTQRAWREPLATYAAELARSTEAEVPVVAVDTELGELAHRLALPTPARRALIALYALYLVGEPAVSIARLGQIVGDWSEGLGGGDLQALALLRRKGGKVALRAAVTGHLDGAAPRAIRVVGSGTAALRGGLLRFARDGKTDAELEAELASMLGRIAVLDRVRTRGLVEARMHGLPAVTFAAPERPPVLPRDGGLVIVGSAADPAWVTALAPLG